MLAYNTTGVMAVSAVEKEICQWPSDGNKYLIGFTATGSYSAEFRLYINNACVYVYQTSPSNRTAYIADRGLKVINGEIVSLRVYHEASTDQQFKGTILGG